ncbi:MAG: hypothetical protein V1752_01965 [Candidatus Firestonebacteria bacterium]
MEKTSGKKEIRTKDDAKEAFREGKIASTEYIKLIKELPDK